MDVRVLLLVDDASGAGPEGRPSLAEQFARFGWKTDVAAPGPAAVLKTGAIESADAYAAVVVSAGNAPEALSGDPGVLGLLRGARRGNRVIAAVDRGVGVLAAAGIIGGCRVAGHPRDVPVIQAAGASCMEVRGGADENGAPPPILDGNLVTGLNGGPLMSEAIRIALANQAGATGCPAASARFAFHVERGSGRSALLLADSLRRNGGALARSALAAVASEGTLMTEEMRARFRSAGIELVTYRPDPRLSGIRLAEKAEAAAAAEVHALSCGAEVLVWMDPDTYILREPSEFLLPEGVQVAFRPVHHKLVGPSAGAPLDEFWTEIFACGQVDPALAFPVTSTMDRRLILFYPNAGCLAARPEAGLLGAWREALAAAADSERLAALARKDPLRSLFFHQAVLAATIVKKVPRAAIRELSFAYNYPVHLHEEAPADLKPGRLEDLVTVRYERTVILEGAMSMAESTRRAITGIRE